MKTSVIRYRVADFLREHPPFDLFSLDDLLDLSGTGRVVFHEDDVHIFQQGQPRDPMLWIIQQGKIQLVNESPHGEKLRDLLGPGDILGLGQSAANTIHPFTARTVTEVILYSFNDNAFEALIQKYPAAARYLTAHLSANAQATKALQAPVNRERLLSDREKSSWLKAAPLPASLLRRRLVTCGPATSLRTAAERLAETQNDAIAVLDAAGAPQGVLTSRQLSAQVAGGRISLNAAVSNLKNRTLPTVPPQLAPAAAMLEMLRQRSTLLGVTADGANTSPLEGLLTAEDLTVRCGRNPVLLFQQMLAAANLEELAYLQQQFEALLGDGLVGPSCVEWFATAVSEVNAVLVERLSQWAAAELARVDRPHPGIPSCWVFLGRAGRREIIAPELPPLGLIYADPPPESAEAIAEYFVTLHKKVSAKLQALGLDAPLTPAELGRIPHCLPLSEWKALFTGLINDPIGNQLYLAREFFDLFPLLGEHALVESLIQHIHEQIELNGSFILLLAHDTLANLPPLTFFQGSVITAEGKVAPSLNLERQALRPILDAARVFALAQAGRTPTNTLDRLAQAAEALPVQASLLADAAEAFRIATYHFAAAELKKKGSAATLLPLRLSKFDQRLLKTAFDAIRRFLDFTTTYFNYS